MTSRAFQDRLNRRARKAGASLTREQSTALEAYFRLLARWNEKINLTAFALQDPRDDAIDRLLVEPVIAAQQLPQGPHALLDIGSGSGSPAIPMRIVAPHARLTMVESKTRKAVFLLEALRHLNIFDATVETARFEQLLTRPELHESFDVLSVRAVRVESSTLLTLQAFLKPHGQLFWFRSATGPEVPSTVAFPLVWTKTVPLVDGAQGRLTVLSKADPARAQG
jgi:16S rRNA (guanine527-N7)-methyltransferase